MIQTIPRPLKLARRVSGKTAGSAAERLYMSERNLFHVEAGGTLTADTAKRMTDVYGLLVFRPERLSTASVYVDIAAEKAELAGREFRKISLNDRVDPEEEQPAEHILRCFTEAAMAYSFVVELLLKQLGRNKKAPSRRQPEQEQPK